MACCNNSFFVFSINNSNFYYKVYEKKLIYEDINLLNNYKINNKPLKLETKKELLQHAKISNYKIFEKDYLLLKLQEYDNSIDNKLSIEKNNFVIITLKSKDKKNNEFLKQKINELIVNETIEIINVAKARSFNAEIISINKKLNDILIKINKNIKNQYIKNSESFRLTLGFNWYNNFFEISENVKFEIGELRSKIIDNNNIILKLLEIDDAEFLTLDWKRKKYLIII